MSTLWPLLRHLLCWQRVLHWLVMMGLAALALSPLVALLIDSHTAFGVFIYGYVAALALPLLAAPVAFRQLIGSRRLALVPHLPLQSGIAWLILTMLAAVGPALGGLLYWPGSIHPQFVPRMFIVASLYAALLQWALCSRYLVFLLSVGPFVLFFLLLRVGPLLVAPSATWATAGLCLAGWIGALQILRTRSDFRPLTKVPLGSTDYLWGTMGWQLLSPGFIGRMRSASGTLLLGYPDGISGRLWFQFVNIILSPLLGVGLLYLVGFSNFQNPPNLFFFYLLFSMISAIAHSLANGELAARSRLLWLRHGGPRNEQWRLVDHTLLGNMLLLALLLLPQTLIGHFVLTAMENFSLLDYLLGTLSCYLLGSYFSLAARIYQWSLVAQFLIIVVLGPGVAVSYNQDAVPLLLLFPAVTMVALLFRSLARRRFLEVDWLQVKPRQSCGKPVA